MQVPAGGKKKSGTCSTGTVQVLSFPLQIIQNTGIGVQEVLCNSLSNNHTHVFYGFMGK